MPMCTTQTGERESCHLLVSTVPGAMMMFNEYKDAQFTL